MKVWTIGFTGRTAETFFGALRRAGIRRLIDVRLHNTSQLAGFTKRSDLPFFLRELCDAEYIHEPLLSPSEDLFQFIKKHGGSWSEFEQRFLALMAERRVETDVDREIFSVPAALLCTEPSPERCHRRLVLQYLHSQWGSIEPCHL